MGPKKNKKGKKTGGVGIEVSVCTPTFNRRPFIPMLIKMYLNQDYPQDKMEWVIIDDGTDPIEDLVTEANIKNLKYFKYDEKMSLGKKRNLMHEKSVGKIIVYMDDDDYYPPERVSHSVTTLTNNKQALCSGSSEIYVYFKHINKVIQFGPYAKNHATAGTFAFKRELLKDGNHYDDDAALAEEKKFLKDYTVPFVQLDPRKTILVFSHDHNTFDKKKLLENPNPQVTKESFHSVKDLVKEGDIRDFFMNRIHGLLKNYEPGLPKHKPDVLKQTEEIRIKREKLMEDERKRMIESGQMQDPNQQIIIEDGQGNKRPLSNQEIVLLLRQRDEQIRNNQVTINQMEYKIKDLEKTISKNEEKQVEVVSSNNENEIIGLLKDKIQLLELQLKNQNKIEKEQVVQVEKKEDERFISITEPNGNQVNLNKDQIIKLLKDRENMLQRFHFDMNNLIENSRKITDENNLLKEKVGILEYLKDKKENELKELREKNENESKGGIEKEIIELSFN